MAQIFQTHRRKIIAVGAIGGGTSLSPIAELRPDKFSGALLAPYLGIKINPFRTPGVKNIEERYSSGGAASTHTPGVATARGNADSQDSRAEGPHKGVGTKYFEENHGAQKNHGVRSLFVLVYQRYLFVEEFRKDERFERG